MPTTNPRINLTLEPQWRSILAKIAAVEGKTIAGLTKELVLEALELREDIALSALAKAREATSKKLVSHEDAWR
ncbi:MAG: hypothetical protein WDO70_10835 [Alphaproteobacteria bacterium]